MTVKVVTDSVSDIPPHVAEELGITVIPLNVRFGQDVYRDGIDISPDEFFQKLQNSSVLPVTSVPSPAVFAETYDRLAAEADSILVLTVTAKLSGTYNVAREAVGLMERKARVEVLDSGVAVMALGFLNIYAARAAKEGRSIEDVIEVVKRHMARVDFRAAFDTLKYLEMGGRIGKAQALLGSILKINPIIGMKDGEVFPYGRERSRAKAVDYLVDFVRGYSRIGELAVEYAAAAEEARALKHRLGEMFPEERIYLARTSPAISTHTGPGLIMVTVLGDR